MVPFSRCLLIGALCSIGFASIGRSAEPLVPEPAKIIKTGGLLPDADVSASCADGKCPANSACSKEKEHGHCCAALARWLFYKPSFAGCEGRLPAYRPPLYTWFADMPCGNSPALLQTCRQSADGGQKSGASIAQAGNAANGEQREALNPGQFDSDGRQKRNGVAIHADCI